MLVKRTLHILKQGAFCSLLAIFGCSPEDEDQTVKKLCDNCSESSAVEFTPEKITLSDSLLLEMPEGCGEINSDIPPKISGNELYLLTQKNYLLKYTLNKTLPKCSMLGRLPKVYSYISDYLVLGDSLVLFCSNEGTNSITSFNLKTANHRMKTNPDNTSLSSMPYLGLSLANYEGQFIFPMVKLEDAVDFRHFLGVYDSKLNYLYGMGNFRTYEDKQFAPYFEAAILSTIKNGIFYATSSSSKGVLKCKIVKEKQLLKVETEELLCFSPAVSERTRAKIKKEQLGDFKLLEKAYISHAYTMGLYTCKNTLIRITKETQPVVNKTTLFKNRLMDAPWTMEVYNFRKKTGKSYSVEALKFRFTNVFVHQNQFYVLSNQSDENKTIYYAIH